MRRDNLGPPKVLANGVVVKPCLQVNEFTLREWRDRLLWDQKIVANAFDAARAGFPQEEIEREFGDRRDHAD